jgi:Uma2 family endonuclease
MPAPKYNPHYKLSDYEQWEGSWELWSGVAVAMTPSPFGKHQKALTKLAHVMMTALEQSTCSDCEVVVELDWIISEDTVVRPDLSVCCGSDIERFIESPPVLIAEVLSDGTALKDRTAKRALYASQGVDFYFLIDTDQEEIEILKLVGSGYEPLQSSDKVEIALSDTCTVTVSLGNKYIFR